MIKLYGNPFSTCTRKVIATLVESNLPYELDVVDFAKGQHKSPEHMARQPFGQVPAIDDDGFSLYESRAIARYVDAKGGGKLTPADPKQRAKMEQWLSVETENFKPHAMKYVYAEVFHRPQTPEVMEHAKQGLETALAVLEQDLTDKPFLVGDQLTIADYSFAPYIEYAMNTSAKEIFAKYPHVMAWWGRVSERPAWKKAAGRA